MGDVKWGTRDVKLKVVSTASGVRIIQYDCECWKPGHQGSQLVSPMLGRKPASARAGFQVFQPLRINLCWASFVFNPGTVAKSLALRLTREGLLNGQLLAAFHHEGDELGDEGARLFMIRVVRRLFT